MTLQEKLAALKEISPQTIREDFTYEQFEFEILGYINEAKEPNYDALFTLFSDVEDLLLDKDYNIFYEQLMLKLFYFSLAYDIPNEVLNGLASVKPIIQLNMLLDETFFKEDKVFAYIMSSYNTHKANNANSLNTLMKYINAADFTKQSEEMKEAIDQLAKTTGLT